MGPAPKSAVKWGSGAGGNSIIQKVKDAENKKAADEAAAAARVIAEANMAAARKANKNKPRPVKAKKGKVVKGEAQQHKARGAQSALNLRRQLVLQAMVLLEPKHLML